MYLFLAGVRSREKCLRFLLFLHTTQQLPQARPVCDVCGVWYQAYHHTPAGNSCFSTLWPKSPHTTTRMTGNSNSCWRFRMISLGGFRTNVCCLVWSWRRSVVEELCFQKCWGAGGEGRLFCVVYDVTIYDFYLWNGIYIDVAVHRRRRFFYEDCLLLVKQYEKATTYISSFLLCVCGFRSAFCFVCGSGGCVGATPRSVGVLCTAVLLYCLPVLWYPSGATALIALLNDGAVHPVHPPRKFRSVSCGFYVIKQKTWSVVIFSNSTAVSYYALRCSTCVHLDCWVFLVYIGRTAVGLLLKYHYYCSCHRMTAPRSEVGFHLSM